MKTSTAATVLPEPPPLPEVAPDAGAIEVAAGGQPVLARIADLAQTRDQLAAQLVLALATTQTEELAIASTPRWARQSHAPRVTTSRTWNGRSTNSTPAAAVWPANTADARPPGWCSCAATAWPAPPPTAGRSRHVPRHSWSPPWTACSTAMPRRGRPRPHACGHHDP